VSKSLRSLRALFEEFVDERLDDGAVRPGGRMETITRSTLPIDEELLKVPSNVVGADRIVNELVPFADLKDRLRARIL